MLHEPVIKVATENLRYTRVKRACASTQAKNSTSNQLKALLPYMLIASCVGDFGHMSVLIACKRNRKKNTLAAFNSVNFVSGAVLSAFYAFSPLLFECCTLKSFGYLLLFFFFFGGTESCSQGLALARQVFYHSSHTKTFQSFLCRLFLRWGLAL
jgi:hypothetical protein